MRIILRDLVIKCRLRDLLKIIEQPTDYDVRSQVVGGGHIVQELSTSSRYIKSTFIIR